MLFLTKVVDYIMPGIDISSWLFLSRGAGPEVKNEGTITVKNNPIESRSALASAHPSSYQTTTDDGTSRFAHINDNSSLISASKSSPFQVASINQNALPHGHTVALPHLLGLDTTTIQPGSGSRLPDPGYLSSSFEDIGPNERTRASVPEGQRTPPRVPLPASLNDDSSSPDSSVARSSPKSNGIITPRMFPRDSDVYYPSDADSHLSSVPHSHNRTDTSIAQTLSEMNSTSDVEAFEGSGYVTLSDFELESSGSGQLRKGGRLDLAKINSADATTSRWVFGKNSGGSSTSEASDDAFNANVADKAEATSVSPSLSKSQVTHPQVGRFAADTSADQKDISTYILGLNISSEPQASDQRDLAVPANGVGSRSRHISTFPETLSASLNASLSAESLDRGQHPVHVQARSLITHPSLMSKSYSLSSHRLAQQNSISRSRSALNLRSAKSVASRRGDASHSSIGVDLPEWASDGGIEDGDLGRGHWRRLPSPSGNRSLSPRLPSSPARSISTKHIEPHCAHSHLSSQNSSPTGNSRLAPLLSSRPHSPGRTTSPPPARSFPDGNTGLALGGDNGTNSIAAAEECQLLRLEDDRLVSEFKVLLRDQEIAQNTLLEAMDMRNNNQKLVVARRSLVAARDQLRSFRELNPTFKDRTE